MARPTSAQVALIALTCFMLAVCYSDARTQTWPEQADTKTGVALRLSPETQTIQPGKFARFTATLINGGKEAVMLVEPGDGSDYELRTPLVDWSSPRPRHSRCGNINPLRANEVFTLQPGESRVLAGWLGQPDLSRAGRHWVALRYTNEPQRRWFGVPLGAHDKKAWAEVPQSTPVMIVSNTVEVIVRP